nr:MAG TPA: hypothetical protein [Caudoviricetes sp.]
MKFKIKSVGYWNKPLEETYPVLNFYKYEQKTRSGYCWTEYFGEIELDTLGDLVILEHNLNEQIIFLVRIRKCQLLRFMMTILNEVCQ